ncbi:hypothetical protein ABM011_01780 [Morganella morganii]|uniref:hypothetical protein n=1 Tax=Morganella morganii TaxID=582 RepID=UPI001648C46E|nr:hypothetical protein [Morganella morganii]MBC3969203.1 hypothetical protein [Morganella morganii]
MPKHSFHQKLIFLLAIIIATVPFYYLKPFQDSLIYWEQAKLIWSDGIITTIEEIYKQTNKVEPLILIAFYLEGLLGLTDSGQFIFSNILICNILIIISAIKILKLNNLIFKVHFVLLILISYLIISNTLYIWRSIYAICFLVLCIANDKLKYKIFFFVLSVLSHQSIILFYFIYFVLCKIPNKSKKNILAYSGVIGLSLYFTINEFMFLSYFISGEVSVFFSSGQDTLIRIFINIYCVLILLLIVSKNNTHYNLVNFCIFLLIISLFLNFNWQIMWRISAPALILTPILALSTMPGKQKKIIIYSALFVSLMPAFRIFYLIIFDTYPN